jgi:probable rRNA maturation factor
MTTVEVSAEGIDLPRWSRRCKIFTRRVVDALSSEEREVSIVFCGDDFIRSLNRDYRGKDEPTDVLSFPQSDGGASEVRVDGQASAGDVVISVESAAKNASAFGVALDEELKRLIIHGIMHLLGWDHEDNSPDQEMLKLQEKILIDLMGERLL